MAQQLINVGTSANDGTGDTLRASQQKTNANTTELYLTKLESIVAGDNITIDNTDPLNPVVNSSGGGSTPLTLIREKFTFASSQSFTLSQAPDSVVYVTVQGQVLDNTQFSISGTSLTVIDTLDSGDIVVILYGFQFSGFIPSLEQVLAVGTTLLPRFANDTGWAQYADTIRTVSAPLVINSGTTTTLPCNGGTTIKTQMPKDFTELFDVATNKLQANGIDDDFIVNIRFKAKTSVVNDFLSIGINIGAGPTVSAKDEVFTRGANTEQQFSIVLPYFTRSTFIANGGLIQITARNGNIQIYDISIKPTLIHKAF